MSGSPLCSIAQHKGDDKETALHHVPHLVEVSIYTCTRTQKHLYLCLAHAQSHIYLHIH